jgi:hypothetical protein
MSEYPVIRLADVKPGDIFFSGGPTFIQEAINDFTDGIFCHSGIIGSGPSDILSSLETSATTVHCQAFEKKLHEPDYILIVEVLSNAKDKQSSFVECYLEFVGKWYGYLSYLWFIYRAAIIQLKRIRLFKNISVPKDVWKWASKNITCTELTCIFLAKLGGLFSTVFNDTDFSGVAPNDLFPLIPKLPTMFRVRGWLIKPNR